jgi:hypothetical protein
MRLHDTDQDIHPIASLLVRGFQHRIGLSYAGIGAEEDLKSSFHPTGFFGLYTFKQRVGIRALRIHC